MVWLGRAYTLTSVGVDVPTRGHSRGILRIPLGPSTEHFHKQHLLLEDQEVAREWHPH